MPKPLDEFMAKCAVRGQGLARGQSLGHNLREYILDPCLGYSDLSAAAVGAADPEERTKLHQLMLCQLFYCKMHHHRLCHLSDDTLPSPCC